VSSPNTPAQRTVLLTGATGFVGRATLAAAAAQGLSIRAVVRGGVGPPDATEVVRIDDLGLEDNWARVVEGVDTVIHLAARVHVMRDLATDPLAAFRAVNVVGTRRLAVAAASAGVRRFVFVSSVKVHGDATRDCPFTPASPLAPTGPYARSKAESELILAGIAAETQMEVVVVRPPLVYGPGVGANFLSLLRLLDRGVPLPLGRVRNRRSLIYVGNLADLLLLAATRPDPVGGAFLVADGPPLSTPELVRRIARALGKSARLLPVPPGLLRAAGAVTGRSAVVDRLLSSLAVDASRAGAVLGWRPPTDMDQGLRRTADWYRSGRG
jgi:nucleoside-diphosphate-sugar epimerase